MYKLIINNFQSLEHAEIKLEGFTTISGPSNRGKSAIIRALGVLFFNEWEANYLKEGTKECKISLDILKGGISKLEIIKPKNTYNVYYRSGEIKEYPKIDKDIPEVVKELGFEIVKTERGDKFNLNIQYQLDSMFLISDKEPAITSFFNKIFKIDRYEKALKSMNADMLKLNKKSKTDLKEIELKKFELEDIRKEYNYKVKRYEEVKEVYKKYIQLKERIEYIEEGEKSFNEIEENKRELEKLRFKYGWYKKLDTYLKGYITNLFCINDVIRLIEFYSEGLDNLRILSSEHEGLKRVFTRVVEYRNCIQKVGEVTFYSDKVHIKKENIKKILEEYEIYSDIQIGIESYFNCMCRLKDIFECTSKSSGAHDLLVSKNQELKEIEKLTGCVQSVLNSMQIVLSVEDRVIELEKINNGMNDLMLELEEYKEIQTEIRGKENFIKIVVDKCPVCNRLFRDGCESK